MNPGPVLLLVCLLSSVASSAKILASIFSPSYSHQIVFRPLWRELADRGHHITLLTTDPMRDVSRKNIKEIDLSGSYEVMESFGNSDILSKKRSEGTPKVILEMEILDVLAKVADWQLGVPEVRNLIRNRSEYFDVLIVEALNPIHMAFAERFNVPFIGVSPQEAPIRIYTVLGNYVHPVIFPEPYLPFSPPLNLKQRLASVAFNTITWYYQYHWRYPQETAIARKHFGNIRELQQIEREMSFLFINVNPTLQQTRPVGMNTIYLGGGMHIGEVKPLPEELQDYLDSSGNQGVIYFSLGSNVKSSRLTGNLLDVIVSTFAALPYKILWKFESSLQDLPENVKIINWAPQRDLLADSRIKLFITQCGLQSLEEGIFNEVPMVGMPFMWDQPGNAKTLEKKGLGLTVDIMNLTKDSFTKTIMEVISNPIYKKNVVGLSKLMKDVEKTGLERAVWWTEYCIRTKGAQHFRSGVGEVPSYQMYLLDVILIVVIACIITTLILVMSVVLCYRICFRRSRSLKLKKS
nr:UDP-glucuronosyltransferase 2B9-like [Leptinotarsa decemlineata]